VRKFNYFVQIKNILYQWPVFDIVVVNNV
jgi:hypothetical protein